MPPTALPRIPRRVCPFAHPGERGRRRPLDKHPYEPTMCAFARRGELCPSGDACRLVRGAGVARAKERADEGTKEPPGNHVWPPQQNGQSSCDPTSRPFWVGCGSLQACWNVAWRAAPFRMRPHTLPPPALSGLAALQAHNVFEVGGARWEGACARPKATLRTRAGGTTYPRRRLWVLYGVWQRESDAETSLPGPLVAPLPRRSLRNPPSHPN
jgi:hypothetical protein